MVNCAGCLRAFSQSGYTLHVRRTRNINCITEFRAQVNSANRAANFEDDWSNGANNECMDDHSEPGAPVQFTGDFFGNYRAEDFQWECEIGRFFKPMYCHNYSLAGRFR